MCTAAAKEAETQILNTIYANWGSPTQLVSWDATSGKPACNMTGITCDFHGQVASLSLYSIPTGSLDPAIFSLTSLSSVALVQVNLIGSIPPQISHLTGLQMLKLSNNFLSGCLPSSLSVLTTLTVLEMNSNQLTGPIPQQLSTLVMLLRLQLGNNKVSGRLPISLSALISLVNFYAPFNAQTGPIPAQYSALQQLTTLALASNSLTSTIPAQLTEIGGLSLSLNNNQAMCGPPLIYGPQPATNIGQDCPTPKPGELNSVSKQG